MLRPVNHWAKPGTPQHAAVIEMLVMRLRHFCDGMAITAHVASQESVYSGREIPHGDDGLIVARVESSEMVFVVRAWDSQEAEQGEREQYERLKKQFGEPKDGA